MTTENTPTVKTLVPWFGSNRTLAANVARALDGCRWVGIPFAGGMSELVHIDAPTIVVNDLHRHVINLANVLRDPYMGPRLIRRLRREAFHDDTLAESQTWCGALLDLIQAIKSDIEIPPRKRGRDD